MIIEQLYTGCLAQGAYYIESDGEAAVIDPLREVDHYIRRAEKDNAKIRYVLETHFHADFVSGHLDLASKTGATIVFGPTAKPGFSAHVAADGEVLKLGKVSIRVLHTPGHTMESSCFVLMDENGKDVALFSGDTLFIGDVGRPDLAQKVIPELTQDKLAAHLYDSLHEKIMPLADDLIVYPAHGAGSACGKNMSRETTDTLGHQKQTNYALRPALNKEAFIKEVLTGLTPPPGYFPFNVLMNIRGYESIDVVMKRGQQALSAREFEAAVNETGALVLDTRSEAEFEKAFIPGSIFIGIDGNFASWAGTMISDINQPILIVAEPGREKEVITRLARVGYDHCIGYLEGGIAAWKQQGFKTDNIISVDVSEFTKLAADWQLNILDVRRKSEYDSEHIIGAVNAPLDYINESMQLINRNKTHYVHCAGGYRSLVFISVLKARGFENLVNVRGGFTAIKQQDFFKLSEYVCPSTLL